MDKEILEVKELEYDIREWDDCIRMNEEFLDLAKCIRENLELKKRNMIIKLTGDDDDCKI